MINNNRKNNDTFHALISQAGLHSASRDKQRLRKERSDVMGGIIVTLEFQDLAKHLRDGHVQLFNVIAGMSTESAMGTLDGSIYLGHIRLTGLESEYPEADEHVRQVVCREYGEILD